MDRQDIAWELEGIAREAALEALEEFLIPIAEEGDANAMYFLGNVYHTNDMHEEAYGWFESASELDHADATFFLGVYSQDPCGFDVVENDIEKAIEYYKKAVEMGSALAMCEMAGRYYQGWDVDKDSALAFELYKKAADMDYYEGYEGLAKCYIHGEGTEKDPERAAKLYQ